MAVLSRRSIDLSEKRFGRLSVESFHGYKNSRAEWNCICDCGNRTVSSSICLRSGRTTSCGCRRIEEFVKRNTTHGRSHTPEAKVLSVAKNSAKKKGIPFNISLDDIPEHSRRCPVLGIPIFRSGEGWSDNTPSLDRIIPEKGYVKGNIRVISWRANYLKNNATLEELRLIGEDAKDLIWEGK